MRVLLALLYWQILKYALFRGEIPAQFYMKQKLFCDNSASRLESETRAISPKTGVQFTNEFPSCFSAS